LLQLRRLGLSAALEPRAAAAHQHRWWAAVNGMASCWGDRCSLPPYEVRWSYHSADQAYSDLGYDSYFRNGHLQVYPSSCWLSPSRCCWHMQQRVWSFGWYLLGCTRQVFWQYLFAMDMLQSASRWRGWSFPYSGRCCLASETLSV